MNEHLLIFINDAKSRESIQKCIKPDTEVDKIKLFKEDFHIFVRLERKLNKEKDKLEI